MRIGRALQRPFVRYVILDGTWLRNLSYRKGFQYQGASSSSPDLVVVITLSVARKKGQFLLPSMQCQRNSEPNQARTRNGGK